MTKFASKYGTNITSPTSPIRSTSETTTNHEGAAARTRDAKSDLFLLGVMNFVSEDTYYESGDARDTRFRDLVHAVTAEDPQWVANFIPWLRNTANMRSAAVVAACEYVNAGGPNGRPVIASACSRADEPAEVLAYWRGVVGKPIPSSVKRGVNDAIGRLWNEFSVAKYDSGRSPFRMGDVVNVTHPKPGDPQREALYKYTQDARFGAVPNVSSLPMLAARQQVNKGDITREQLLSDPELMKRAGMTWESLSGLGPMDAAAWEAVIPQMGYMALLRNLRNFEQAGISPETTQRIIDKLKDPAQVAKSRQLPFRFWSAYKNAQGLQWAYALEQALDLSLRNLPDFGGKTLVLTDSSGSMTAPVGGAHSSISRLEAGALFAAALALKGEKVDFYAFADRNDKIDVSKGGSVLKAVERVYNRAGVVGWGTNITGAINAWDGHDRVLVVTDMQINRGYQRHGQSSVNLHGSRVPSRVPIYGFNLGGYATTQIGDNNEYEFGGLTDHTFKMIPLLERRQSATWPWED